MSGDVLSMIDGAIEDWETSNIMLYGVCGCGWARHAVLTPAFPDYAGRLDLLCSNSECANSVPGR